MPLAAAAEDAPPSPPLPVSAPSELLPALSGDPFKEALAGVYAHHPQLRAQREIVKAVDESVAQAISGFRPNAAASYEFGRERVRGGGGAEDWNYDNAIVKGLNVTQDVFNGGESWASFKSARERVRAARAQLVDVEQQVLLSAVAAYTAVVETRSVLEANQNNVDVLQKQLDDTGARFEVGDITKTDVSQAEARLSQARADERLALGDYETARVAFRRTIGYEAPADIGLPPLPSALPPTLDEATALALSASPVLETAKYLENAAGTDVDVRTASLFPDVSIRGTMSRSESPSTVSGLRQVENDALTLNVSIPLYQSGAEWSRIRQARNDAAQARFLTIDTRAAVVEAVTRAWHDYNTARAVIVSTGEASRAARLALEGVRLENQSGVRTVLDVLNAEQESFLAHVNLVRAQSSERVQAYRLLASMGRLTARELGLPVELYDPKDHYDDVKYKLLGF